MSGFVDEQFCVEELRNAGAIGVLLRPSELALRPGRRFMGSHSPDALWRMTKHPYEGAPHPLWILE